MVNAALGCRGSISRLTDLVELNDVWLCAQLAEQRLGSFAVRAVGLGEDGFDIQSGSRYMRCA